MTRAEQKVEDLRAEVMEALKSGIDIAAVDAVDKKVADLDMKVRKLVDEMVAMKKQLNSLGPILQKMQAQIDTLKSAE